MLKKIYTRAQNALVQWHFYRCIVCDAPSDRPYDLCSSCLALLPALSNACARCAEPFPFPAEGVVCGKCLQKTPSFDTIQAPWRYEGPIPHLIKQLKFNQKLAVAHVLGNLLAARIQAHYQGSSHYPDVILPVPLHQTRLRTRGFNQALELARPVAKILGRPLLTQNCVRVRNTGEQARLPVALREKNLKNAFTVVKPLVARHVLVVDDVVTTTHTVDAFCTALKKQGAARADVWCCARTPAG